MSSLERGIFVLVAGLCVASCLVLVRRQRLPYAVTVLGLVVLVYFGAHLVIEVQARYRYCMMPALFALGAPALGQVYDTARTRGARRAAPAASPIPLDHS